jgi:hypothetical protein
VRREKVSTDSRPQLLAGIDLLLPTNAILLQLMPQLGSLPNQQDQQEYTACDHEGEVMVIDELEVA